MKQSRISLERFDLEALLEQTLDFLKGQVSPGVHPTYGIVWGQSFGEVPIFGPESGWDVASALKKKKRKVFFPFAYANADGTFTCADGHTYKQAPDDEDSEDQMFIGMEDSLRYLVQITGTCPPHQPRPHPIPHLSACRRIRQCRATTPCIMINACIQSNWEPPIVCRNTVIS